MQNPPCFNESTTKDLKHMSKATPEELLGIIQGLTDAMKLTHEQQQATNTQVQQLSNTIKDMSTHSKTFSIPSGLRLPAISLPKYSGSPQDNLERFLEHFDSILTTSSIPARYYVPYLKQQVQEDIRAFDVVTNAEKEHFTKLIKTPDKATDEEYLTYYNRIKEVLILKRGKPKEQQIRELLSEYYSMEQGKTEKVSDFAHRFQDIQSELEKHITNIHSDLELQYAFAIKLRKEIQQEITSREFKYTSLQEVVATAERYETQHPPPINKSDWQPSAMSTHSADTTLKKKLACRFCHKTNHLEKDCFQRNKQANTLPMKTQQIVQGQSKAICRDFNNFPHASCELSNNRCRFGRQHKCLTCGKFGCKRRNHPQTNSYSHPPKPRVNSNLHNVEISEALPQAQPTTSNVNTTDEKLEKLIDVMTDISTKLPAAVQAETTQPSPLAPLFGTPAVTTLTDSTLQGLDLTNKNILWTKVQSGNRELPLPIDTGCSLSLVSASHA